MCKEKRTHSMGAGVAFSLGAFEDMVVRVAGIVTIIAL
jgi:hypothetical protein